MSLEQLLVTRARIAHLGEKSQQNWWNSEAHSKAGGLLLGRLLPRTAQWSAVELAMDAAAAAHRQHLPAIPTVTLFDLGEKVNRAVADLLLQKKLQGESAAPFAEPITEATELCSPEQAEAVRKFAKGLTLDRTVHIGDVAADADLTAPEVWGKLVAGYQFSTPGRLVVPYLRLV